RKRQLSLSEEVSTPSLRTPKSSKSLIKEERRKRAQEIDQYRRQLSTLQKRFNEVESSLEEATRKLDYLNQRLSDPNLYLNQKETYETIEAQKQTKEQVRQLTQLWEFLALELEEMKLLNPLSE
ncbi:MAG: hypothetical protein QXY90_05665, partial [Candidatus Anstonellales archaeon]